jgi:hypothetical protein
MASPRAARSAAGSCLAPPAETANQAQGFQRMGNLVYPQMPVKRRHALVDVVGGDVERLHGISIAQAGVLRQSVTQKISDFDAWQEGLICTNRCNHAPAWNSHHNYALHKEHCMQLLTNSRISHYFLLNDGEIRHAIC